MGIGYYSTNKNLDNVQGIIPFKGTVSFCEALLRGQAPDGGLFMPEHIPALDLDDVRALKDAPYCEAAKVVARLFLRDELNISLIDNTAENAYNFLVPLEHVFERKYIMRLDQGPTGSFKDFAARLMARLMAAIRERERPLNILVATSGDTGSAVGSAFHNLADISVTILYPRAEVSELQKKQLDTIGDNVCALSVDGKFDDCQRIVKRAFADADFAAYNLNSANSINFGRIMPQIVYYVYAYAQLAEREEEIVFSVPSGNFGNALGCEYARRMGLPVKCLLMPVNENDEFAEFLRSGLYRPIIPSLACLSSAMNVGNPSNLARFFDLYGGTLDRDGAVHQQPDVDLMRGKLFSISVPDEETRATIKKVMERYEVLLEPHGAVAWRGLEEYLHRRGDFPLCVSLETAHPAKFPEVIKDVCGINPQEPPFMRDLASKNGQAFKISADYDEIKEYLLRNLPR